jgi:hypothetical protein
MATAAWRLVRREANSVVVEVLHEVQQRTQVGEPDVQGLFR